ncbi:MAG: type II toxin-antitoxin system VapC family toxin [Chloroflexi bacterium]|nr:type II toxin-antitoxin system VapC family toxin [Chloroflexota bacterium]
MKILLDTHTFLWSLSGKHFSDQAQEVFLDPQNSLALSMASYWEICIKLSLGKLKLQSNWEQVFDQEMVANQIQWLSIEKEHCRKIVELPFIHRDPFDRLLIAQAICEDMTLLTVDKMVQLYDVPTIW